MNLAPILKRLVVVGVATGVPLMAVFFSFIWPAMHGAQESANR